MAYKYDIKNLVNNYYTGSFLARAMTLDFCSTSCKLVHSLVLPTEGCRDCSEQLRSKYSLTQAISLLITTEV